MLYTVIQLSFSNYSIKSSKIKIIDQRIKLSNTAILRSVNPKVSTTCSKFPNQRPIFRINIYIMHRLLVTIHLHERADISRSCDLPVYAKETSLFVCVYIIIRETRRGSFTNNGPTNCQWHNGAARAPLY